MKESLYSEVAEFFAAPLPEKIIFPADPFVEMNATSLKFTWLQPTVDTLL